MLDTVNPITTGIRLMFISLDLGIYYLLRFIYELFFNIATFNILDRGMIFSIFSRIQLIVGIFMMFQLVMLIIKGIVNPDTVSDSKSGGAASIIMRIIVSLALLALIIPINIPSPKNEYEKQIHNNGVLFGTLYSLQYRVLSNNTLGRLILGNDATDYTSPDSSNQALSHFADEFSTRIAKTFYTLNMGEDGQKYVCGDGWDKTYNQTKNPFIIVAAGARQCNLIGTKYSLSMSYLIGTVAVAVLVIVMFMMCFEVAKRVFQLAALQLIAPVPIISYMDPNGSKDGAFSSWVKLLVSTYTELFVRLAVIYFSLGVIDKFSEKFFGAETALSTTTKVISGAAGNAPQIIKWTFIIMCIGLFIFAKDAPKFFKQMLGIKSDKKFFDSFGQALGVGAVAAGAVSGGVSGAVSKYESTDGNKGKKIGAAIMGGLGGLAGGGVNAGKKFFTSKDGNFQGIMEANRKYAAQQYANAADESTPSGRFMAGLQSNAGLKNDLQKMDDKIKYYNAASDALSRITKAFDGNGDYKFKYDGPDIFDSNNKKILGKGEMKSLKDMNDLCNFYSSDGVASTALDKAKKAAQSNRFTQIRRMKREDIEKEIKQGTMSTNDLVVYDSGKRIYDVATKYIDEPEFARFKDQTTGKIFAYNDDGGKVSFKDMDATGNTIVVTKDALDFGAVFKHDAGQAGKSADQIKNSDEYAQASANAKRAQEASKPK